MLSLLLLLLTGDDGAGSSGPYIPPPPTLPTEDPQPVVGWPLWSDRTARAAPTLSGGAWRSTLPLANLQDRQIALVARSVDCALASTQFDVDLTQARSVGLLALVGHNLTTASKVRWCMSDTAGDFSTPVYTSGWVNAWPTYASEEDMDGLNVNYVHLPTVPQSARYARCEIDDQSNPDGFVQVGRLFVSGVWVPSTGIAIGAKLGLESATERIETDGGAALYRQKPMRRSWDASVPLLEEIESFGTVFRMLRQLGTYGQCFFVFDRNDPFMHERAFLAVMRELSAIEYPYADAQSVAIRLLEEI